MNRMPWGIFLNLVVAIATAATAADPPPPGSYTIAGKCVDQDSSQPLSGVRLQLFVARGPEGEAELLDEVVTSPKGDYEFRGLEPPDEEGHLRQLSYALVADTEGRPIEVVDVWLARFNQLQRGQRENRERADIPVEMARESGSLRGRVTDSEGRPVRNALVSRGGMRGGSIPGIYSARTDADGQYVIDRLPVMRARADRPDQVWVAVSHPDYLASSGKGPRIPGTINAVLAPGHRLTGLVRNGPEGPPAGGVLVTAAQHGSGETYSALTDAEGRYQVVVRPGQTYQVRAEALDRVSVALTDIEVESLGHTELPGLTMTPGGLITGRIRDSRTGNIVTVNDEGRPIALGLFGPSHPYPRVISPLRLAMVDEEGRFTLRAAAGDNFPYFVNIRGNRMGWDTLEQPAVVAKEGETVETELLVVRELTPEEKMAQARKVQAELPKEPSARATAILEQLRSVGDEETWCLLTQDLVQLGPVAVPAICEELDQTTGDRSLRRIAFVLRAIGDPRAVPALIRALPRTLVRSSSDYGMLVDDPALTAFMQQHDLEDNRGRYFGFQRPNREVSGALQRLTGQKFDDQILNGISLRSEPRAQALQRRLFLRQAHRWRDWWEAHAKELTAEADFHQVRLPEEPQEIDLTPAPLGPQARLDDGAGVTGMVVSPAVERGGYSTHFMDLDTGLCLSWPAEIPRDDSGTDPRLAAWAAENGLDLMCVAIKAGDLEAYSLRTLGMTAVEITPAEARTLEKQLARGELPAGRMVEDLLLHSDPGSGELIASANAAFLYTTREGGRGLIEVTDRVTKVEDLTGAAGFPAGVGFHLGVRFNHRPIVP